MSPKSIKISVASSGSAANSALCRRVNYGKLMSLSLFLDPFGRPLGLLAVLSFRGKPTKRSTSLASSRALFSAFLRCGAPARVSFGLPGPGFYIILFSEISIYRLNNEESKILCFMWGEGYLATSVGWGRGVLATSVG